MNDDAIFIYAYKMMRKWGLTDKGWTFEFVNKPYGSPMGTCHDSVKKITLNRHYISRGLEPHAIKDTILHEIAHALDDGPARVTRTRYNYRVNIHDATWREYAVMVGATPRARGKLDGYVRDDNDTIKAKWVMVYVSRDDEMEFIRPVKRFFDTNMRIIKGRPETSGRLYLCLSKHWVAHSEGRLRTESLKFWQDNPNCKVWGPGPVKRIGDGR